MTTKLNFVQTDYIDTNRLLEESGIKTGANKNLFLIGLQCLYAATKATGYTFDEMREGKTVKAIYARRAAMEFLYLETLLFKSFSKSLCAQVFGQHRGEAENATNYCRRNPEAVQAIREVYDSLVLLEYDKNIPL